MPHVMHAVLGWCCLSLVDVACPIHTGYRLCYLLLANLMSLDIFTFSTSDACRRWLMPPTISRRHLLHAHNPCLMCSRLSLIPRVVGRLRLPDAHMPRLLCVPLKVLNFVAWILTLRSRHRLFEIFITNCTTQYAHFEVQTQINYHK